MIGYFVHKKPNLLIQIQPLQLVLTAKFQIYTLDKEPLKLSKYNYSNQMEASQDAS